MLLRISAPHFVAGVILWDGVVVNAAPILRWSVGKTEGHLRDYCHRKHWQIETIDAQIEETNV